jgi:hypothetical protein
MLGTKNMSSENEAVADADEVCASCGRPAVDDVKLKKCACNLVKYCTVDCQKDHRPQHKKICKRRLAEIRDRDLFEQPDESHLGDCPICCLPLPDNVRNTFMSCCSKLICDGCNYANQMREIEAVLDPRCAFCREPLTKSDEENEKRVMNRIKKNDPAAMSYMGKRRRDEGDYETAFKYFTKAAELGDASAHFELSVTYWKGQGVEKDMKKEAYHLEEAAIAGDPSARHNLGAVEVNNGRYQRAKKHFIIATSLGDDKSLNVLKDLNAAGFVSEEEYTAAQRAYQVAVDATKSSEREEAIAYYDARGRGRDHS